jgi:hypothetical protein
MFLSSNCLLDSTLTHCQKVSTFRLITERWVRLVREEYLDQVLILNRRHLQRVLLEYGATRPARIKDLTNGRRFPLRSHATASLLS